MAQCIHCLSEIPEDRAVCGVCGTQRLEGSQSPTMSGAAGAQPAAASDTPLDRGRFLAGTVLAGRYRIIGLLGSGGMGEVYKAEDLKLHQLAALKFLPEAFSNDAGMVARFHREVRTARQITHPNVCRVHDIGQIQLASTTLHFISMEYIDGEDLATLLRRIGHLPVQKGMELARQICSGLSAAHEMGVVHRDLKPANIMLDGRGRARITDFGLSGLVEDFGRDEHSGTPAYMAPEQLLGGSATPRSDIYALGLVLYEIFTGKRPFTGRNIAELMDQHRSATPPPPSSRIREIDPVAERAILRCLAREPAERPSGPLEILSALSQGDPLGKALAAGETPSPEMVAAAGQKTGLKPAIAWASLITIAVIAIAVAVPINPAKAHDRTLGTSPDVLVNDARKLRNSLGYVALKHSAYGYTLDKNYERRAHSDKTPKKFYQFVSESRPGWGRWWYKESEAVLRPGFIQTTGLAAVFANLGAKVQEGIPDDSSSIVKFAYDVHGFLTEFRATPESLEGAAGAVPDWTPLFMAAGIDPSALTSVQPERPPPTPFDHLEAWSGFWPQRPDIPLTVQAAGLRGKPVFFKAQMPLPTEAASGTADAAINIGVIVFVMITAGAVARRNVLAGRGDRRGAFRVGVFSFVVLLLSWAFGSDHRLDPHEVRLFFDAAGEALLRSALVGILYLAVEPFVRQRWPHVLIPWNRVLEGRFRDPVVGGALLAGIVFASLNAILRSGLLMMEVMSTQLPETELMNALRLDSYTVSLLLGWLFDSVSIPLGMFFLFSIFRIVLRSQLLAGVLLAALVSGFVNLAFFEVTGTIVAIAFSVLWLVAVTRFGLIAGMSMWFVDRVFRTWSMLGPDSWYGGRMYLLLAAVLLLSIYAFITSLGGRSIVPVDLLGDRDNTEHA